MRLLIRNLGRIEQADIDVRPLTVLIGPNGTNKTWTVYVLYALLRELSWGPLSKSALGVKARSESEVKARGYLHQRLEPLLRALMEQSGPSQITTRVDVKSWRSLLGDPQELSGIGSLHAPLLGLPPESMADTRIALSFRFTEMHAPITSARLVYERAPSALSCALFREDQPEEPAFEAVETGIHEASQIVDIAFQAFHKSRENIIPFPADRKALTAYPMSWPSSGYIIPAPVLDYMRFLNLGLGMAPGSSGFADTLPMLERSILGGTVDISKDAGAPRLQLRLPGGSALPMPAASSLSQTMAGLWLYLDRFAKPDDVLVIDELEMNAHPRAQLALTELIAVLVNRGLNVVFTTHSPYIVDHLNNLMEAALVTSEQQDGLAQKFVLQTKEAFIRSEQVAAHVFDEAPSGKVEVKDVMDREEGVIGWTTFGSVSDYISNIYGDILRMRKGSP